MQLKYRIFMPQTMGSTLHYNFTKGRPCVALFSYAVRLIVAYNYTFGKVSIAGLPDGTQNTLPRLSTFILRYLYSRRKRHAQLCCGRPPFVFWLESKHWVEWKVFDCCVYKLMKTFCKVQDIGRLYWWSWMNKYARLLLRDEWVQNRASWVGHYYVYYTVYKFRCILMQWFWNFLSIIHNRKSHWPCDPHSNSITQHPI
jgi:hypothetical protein